MKRINKKKLSEVTLASVDNMIETLAMYLRDDPWAMGMVIGEGLESQIDYDPVDLEQFCKGMLSTV